MLRAGAGLGHNGAVTLFGRYEYVAELGRGTTGRVFSALDVADGGSPRALKVVPEGQAGRLVWEFSRLACVQHPRVARVRELLRIEAAAPAPFALAVGELVLVEDRVAGLPLQQALEANSVHAMRPGARLAFVLRAAVGVSEALTAIHDAGLVHGDVKPDNVLWDVAHGATLIDLGFARAPTIHAQVRGTPAFMSPELLAGVCTPAADVFALGALVFDALLSDKSEYGSESMSGARAGIGAGRDVGALRGTFPDVAIGLVQSFLEPSPELRVRDGRAALAALVGLLRALGEPVDAESVRYAGMLGVASPRQRAQDARTLPFVGHEGALQELTQAIDAALERRSGTEIVVVSGPRGAGSTRLVRESVRVLHAQRAQAGRPLPTLMHAIAGLEKLREVDCVALLERPDASTLQQALRAQAAFATAGRILCVVVEGIADAADLAVSVERVRTVHMAALDAAAFDALARRLVTPQKLEPVKARALQAKMLGLSGRLCESVARALLAGSDPLEAVGLLYDEGAAYSSWSEGAFDLAVWLAWSSEPVLTRETLVQRLGGRERVERSFDELVLHGAVSDEGEALCLKSHLAQQVRELGAELWLERFASLFAGELPADAPFLWAALGDKEAAVLRFLRDSALLVEKGEHDAALRWLSEAHACVDDAKLKLALANLERKRARYGVALKILADVQGEEAAWTRSELARLAGDAASAEHELSSLTSGSWSQWAQAQKARLRYDAGDYAGAVGCIEACKDTADEHVRMRAGEVAVLLALVQDGPDRVQARELVALAERTGELRHIARALGLKAYVEGQAGQRGQAILDLRRAVSLSKQAGELHEHATFGLNLGLLELEDGQLGQATYHLQDAAYTLAWIDRPADLLRVLYNLGNAALLLGDNERAESVLLEASRGAANSVDHAAKALVAVSQSELHIRRGATEAAARLLEEALSQVPQELSYVRGIVLARTGLLQLLRGNGARAEELRLLARPAWPEASEVAGELALFDLRSLVAKGEFERASELADTWLLRAGEQVSFSLRVRLLLAATDAAHKLGDEERAAQHAMLCRRLIERVLSALPQERRARMRNVPEFARMLSVGRGIGHGAGLGSGPERWRALVRGGRRLFSEARPRRIAKHVTELALDLVHAERALVVHEVGEELRVLVRTELAAESGRELGFSRSVVRRAFLDKEPVVSLEVGDDERFDQAHSLHALSVRSVLAVPLDGFGHRAVLYLDDRLRASAFGVDDQLLLLDLCELARQALQVGHAVLEERRRAQAAGQQERRAVRQLAELNATPVESEEQRPFIGTSLALRQVTETARKVAQADVPLVIQGPSGTGKELLARFVHAQGPRRAAPFVAENCAALPDPMLESALFGHVRGAFTGADRARRGLFELADGGSLLLDEVAEMSPAMQGKLLRVLQEGEFRALGSEKVKKVNVRVMAASHRHLPERVEAGLFREDLYYRLAVVTLEVPSLSERREDIPLLVRHFIEKHASSREVRVSQDAMRLWETRAYPGNIRQLENEVRRALALAEHDIESSHIETFALHTPEKTLEFNLELHAQTEALTRKLVGQAMERTRGNVSQAAQLLGVSRFGLQKILKRISGEAN